MISVVIPSYNRKESVLALLADIYLQENVEFEVIVVDDCSPDGSANAIAANYPQAVLLRNERNGGPCVTRNRGIRAARGRIVVGFDSDVTVPDRHLLARVGETFQGMPDSVVALAFHLLQPDGISEDSARWWHPVPIGSYADKCFETSYFSGTGYAFRKEAVIAAGLFPEILYMHYEEVELAWRILDQGGTILHSPHLRVLHHEHQVSRRTEVKVFYKVRNQILLAAACLPAISGLTFLAPRIIYAMLNALRSGHLASFARALNSAATLMPERLRQRKPLSGKTRKRIADMRAGLSSFSHS